MSDEIISSSKAVTSQSDQRLVRVPPGYEVVVDQEESQSQMHLRDFALMLWQRRWLILGIFLLCVVPTVIYLKQSRQRFMYQATAKVRLGVEPPDVDLDNTNNRNDKGPSVDTQLEILRSRSMAA